MEKIDITMTATLRPLIIEETFKSICDRIVKNEKDRYRLIINVDPIGEKVKKEYIKILCRNYFNDIIFNFPENACFPKAQKWVWENTSSNYIFNIQDDWIFIRDINVDHMISILNKYPMVCSLRLNKKQTPSCELFPVMTGSWKYIKEDKFYLMSEEHWNGHISLNPNLFKKDFIKKVTPLIVENRPVEAQLHPVGNEMAEVVKSWRYGCYTNPGDEPLIKDIGRKWIQKSKFRKPSFTEFISWRPK